MNKQKEIIDEAKKLLKVVDQFNATMRKAGSMGFTVEDLEKMTAIELICLIAPNGISFVYNKGL